MIDDWGETLAFVSPISEKTLLVMLERTYIDRSAKQALKIVQYESKYIVRTQIGQKLTGNEKMREYAEAISRDKNIAIAERAAVKFRTEHDRLAVIKKKTRDRKIREEIPKVREQEQRKEQRRSFENLYKREQGLGH